MLISEILENKRKTLIATGDPLAVSFSSAEIKALKNLTELRIYKLKAQISDDFERSSDLIDCSTRILNGDDLNRVLEFCMLKNPYVGAEITAVFPILKRPR